MKNRKQVKPIDWSKVKPGAKFNAVIRGTKVTGEIQIERDEIFLCQDKEAGDRARDTRGYNHSYNIGDGCYELVSHHQVELIGANTFDNYEIC